MRTIRNKLLLILCIALSLTACDSKRVFDEYVSVSTQSWNSDNPVLFTFNVQDTINKKGLFINIRNNKKYAFSNLFLITHLNFPNGKKIVDTLEYEMTDVAGNFLGKGFTEIKESKLFYKENVVFLSSGDYSISIAQAMRESGKTEGIEKLEGITDVGFRIEKN